MDIDEVWHLTLEKTHCFVQFSFVGPLGKLSHYQFVCVNANLVSSRYMLAETSISSYGDMEEVLKLTLGNTRFHAVHVCWAARKTFSLSIFLCKINVSIFSLHTCLNVGRILCGY